MTIRASGDWLLQGLLRELVNRKGMRFSYVRGSQEAATGCVEAEKLPVMRNRLHVVGNPDSQQRRAGTVVVTAGEDARGEARREAVGAGEAKARNRPERANTGRSADANVALNCAWCEWGARRGDSAGRGCAKGRSDVAGMV